MSTDLQQTVTIHVHYPLASGRMLLRTDQDWGRNVEPIAVSDDGLHAEFSLALDRPYLYFKPVIAEGNAFRWSVGHNYLVVAGRHQVRDIYPYFYSSATCTACELQDLDSSPGSQGHAFRVFYPPGHEENTLKRYPVLYMQDGQNLFFSGEAFLGVHWKIRETLVLLDAMNLVDKVIVVGVYPYHREDDYTLPGYEAYGRFLVENLKPHIDREYRTLSAPENTAVMGSSLGGVVSFYLAWQYPEVFGMAACMSSTFGWQDNLRQRVMDEPRRNIRLYLDSGYPNDNYEVTRDLRALLAARGFREGLDLMYLAFPEALHSEQFWAMRAHIPVQFLFGQRS